MLSGGVPAAHDLQLNGRPLVRCRQGSLGGAGWGAQQNTAYGVQQHNGRKKAQQRSPKAAWSRQRPRLPSHRPAGWLWLQSVCKACV